MVTKKTHDKTGSSVLAYTMCKNVFSVFALTLTFILGAKSQCSEELLPQDVPSFLIPQNTFSNYKRYRCPEGKVFNLTDEVKNYIEIKCENDQWTTIETWPTEDSCIAGDACQISDLTGDFTDYLSKDINNDITELASGTFLPMKCKEATKVLNGTHRNFSLECIHGSFEPPNEIPEADDCVTGQSCDLEEFTERRSYMDTNQNMSISIPHGSKIGFFCLESRTLVAVKDVDDNNEFEIDCFDGEMKRKLLWPEEEECLAKCTELDITFTDLGFEVPSTLETLSGSHLNLTCANSDHLVNDTWDRNYLPVPCQHSGQFKGFSSWPACIERKPCGPPPLWPVNSALRAENETDEIRVPDSAIFNCRDEGQVTNIGPSVELKCIIRPGEENATFEYPSVWGTQGGKCRAPVKCREPFEAPLETGLELVEQEEPYLEFGYAEYRCKNQSFLLYKDQKPLSATKFKIQCGYAGYFKPPPDGWPLCDSLQPEKCSDYPSQVPDFVEIVKEEAQLPGGKIYYKCKEEGFVTNIGDLAAVECVKHLNQSVSFEYPSGWSNLKCRSKLYPNFDADPCICPGDPDLTDQQHKEILELCYWNEEQFSAASMSVPMKKRCGVGSLENITIENMCHCTERTNDATDFSIWSRVEMPLMEFHINYTEPSTLEFKRAKRRIEMELDRRIIDNFEGWKYVRSKVITFVPAKARACSLDELQSPPDGSGLMLNSTDAIEFNQFAVFNCPDDQVTDDGPLFKIKCLPNGQYQSRKWKACRERKVCEIRPPKPPTKYGLARDNTRGIKEFENATYACKDPNMVVSGTEDGKFRVMCKKGGRWPQAQGKYGVNWPTCQLRPADVCEPVMEPPPGYTDDFERTLFVTVGTQIAFRCENEGFLADDQEKIYYRCSTPEASGNDTSNETSGNVLVAEGHNEDEVPACRQPTICPWSSFETPPRESGLAMPLQPKNITEREYVEYTCIEKGPTWSLLGEYISGQDFVFDDNVDIVDGKLQIKCIRGVATGTLGKVEMWPICRDASVQGCKVSSENPVLPNKDLKVVPGNGMVEVGDEVEIKCKDQSEVTDEFQSLKVVCGFDGKLTLPEDTDFSSCRAPKSCPAIPQPPAETNLKPEPLGLTITDDGLPQDMLEHQVFEFECQDEFTLAGLMHDLVEDQKVNVPCLLSNGSLQEPQAWPQCRPVVEECTDLPPEFNKTITNSTTLPVAKDDSATFTCINSDKVTYLGPNFSLKCTESGLFDMTGKVPQCRTPITCPAPPSPPENSLLESLSTFVTEWSSALYRCRNGSKLPDDWTENVVDGNFTVLCGADVSYQNPINWPTCEITHCMQIPEQEGFTTDKSGPIEVDEKITYECTDSLVVNDTSLSLESTCQQTGEFTLITEWPGCRSALTCPALPTPPETSFLVENSTEVLEFEYALFACQDGARFAENEAEVEDNYFQLLCGANGEYAAEEEISWPTCIVENCTALVEKAGYISATQMPIAVNEQATYQCENGKVTDIGASWTLKCGENGRLIEPEEWPQCRDAKLCTNIPNAPANSNLQNPDVTSVKEYQYARYPCKADGKFSNSESEAATAFELQCPLGGSFAGDNDITWPLCLVSHCIDLPSINGFSKKTSQPVAVGNAAEYECITSGQVNDFGKVQYLQCLSDGSFVDHSNWPPCRDPLDCSDPIPTPDSTSKLESSLSTDLKEFDQAIFACPSGLNLAHGPSQFSLTCGLNGQFPVVNSWPECKITSCAIPTVDGFTAQKTGKIDIGESITYKCTDENLVSDQGKEVSLICNEDGTINFPESLTCREPIECTDPPPEPPENSNFKALDYASPTKEFSRFSYQCKDGFGLLNGYNLGCLSNGNFESVTDWPICSPLCTTPITVPDTEEQILPVSDTFSVVKDQKVNYKCEQNGYVFDTGKYFQITCGDDGNLIAPDPWPACRQQAYSCGQPPSAPESTNLMLTNTAVAVSEFDEVLYECKPGFTLVNADSPGDGQIIEVDNKLYYQITCWKEDAWSSQSDGDWAKCIADGSISKKRKKRYITYEGLYPDLKYSMNVIFETQWMYTKVIEDEILASEFNKSMDDPLFPKAVIDTFHQKIENTLGDALEMGEIQMKYPIYPTCEQPMTSLSPTSCVATGLAPVCSNEKVESPWLKSLGFSYLKQQPNWMDESNPDTPRHQIPVGGAIEFYCSDVLKRPKKDVWDLLSGDDNTDGILTAYCTHEGELSMTMNPADWNRCARKCPVSKPKPDLVEEGAELVFNSTNYDYEVWEDETISYACRNKSLVFNNVKGVYTVSYRCREDGIYDTPRGKEEGDPWPECTLKPIDPLIVDAIVLLTGKFDRNLVYRQELKKTGNTEPDTLGQMVAIMGIALPTMGAIVAFIFLCMCFTRADSPICKICEPQA